MWEQAYALLREMDMEEPVGTEMPPVMMGVGPGKNAKAAEARRAKAAQEKRKVQEAKAAPKDKDVPAAAKQEPEAPPTENVPAAAEQEPEASPTENVPAAAEQEPEASPTENVPAAAEQEPEASPTENVPAVAEQEPAAPPIEDLPAEAGQDPADPNTEMSMDEWNTLCQGISTDWNNFMLDIDNKQSSDDLIVALQDVLDYTGWDSIREIKRKYEQLRTLPKRRDNPLFSLLDRFIEEIDGLYLKVIPLLESRRIQSTQTLQEYLELLQDWQRDLTKYNTQEILKSISTLTPVSIEKCTQTIQSFRGVGNDFWRGTTRAGVNMTTDLSRAIDRVIVSNVGDWTDTYTSYEESIFHQICIKGDEGYLEHDYESAFQLLKNDPKGLKVMHTHGEVVKLQSYIVDVSTSYTEKLQYILDQCTGYVEEQNSLEWKKDDIERAMDSLKTGSTVTPSEISDNLVLFALHIDPIRRMESIISATQAWTVKYHELSYNYTQINDIESMRTLLPYLGAGDTVSNMLDNFKELNTKHIPLGKARADQAFALMTANNRIISRWNSVTETYSSMLRSLMYMPEVDSQLTALDQRLVALEAQLAASSKQQADSGASMLTELTDRLERMEGRLRLYALM